VISVTGARVVPADVRWLVGFEGRHTRAVLPPVSVYKVDTSHTRRER
jgi:hypothetical protein